MKEVILLLYYQMPLFCQNLAISLYGIILYINRYSGVYKQYLKLFSRNDHSDLAKEKRIQNKRFLRLLHYAVKKSSFYQEFYKEVTLKDIKSVKDIGKLPILTRNLLQENLYKIYTVSSGKSLSFSTGGTGGAPLRVRKRRRDVRQRMAYLDAYKLTFGFQNNKMKSARFFGKKIIKDTPGQNVFWRSNYPLHQRLYSTYHLTEENIPYYVKDLNRYKPQAIDGFVSAIYTIARYMEENQISPSFTPIAVFTTSETVLPFQRETIEKVFGCPLSDQYASNEGAPFIIQCRCGAYHEAIDTGIFEHIPTKDGIKLLVTGFDTFGTPLIRYDIGDMVIEDDINREDCPCKSVHPVIKGIAGRESDFLVTGRARYSQVQLSVLAAELSAKVKQIQFHQRTDGSIHIRCIPSDNSQIEKTKKYITGQIEKFFGSGIGYELEFTDTIDRTSAGKYRLISKDTCVPL